MASPAARPVSSHAGSKARLGQTIRREGREVSPAISQRYLVIAQRKIVGQTNVLPAGRESRPAQSPARSRLRLPVEFEELAPESAWLRGQRDGDFVRRPSGGEKDGRSERRTPLALAAALDRLRGATSLDRVSTPSDRRIAVSNSARSMMLLAPDVPVIGLDAPGAGGLLDLDRRSWSGVGPSMPSM